MKRIRKFLSITLIAVIVLSTLTACSGGGGTSSTSKEPIVIGTLLPKTGTGAVFGQAIWQGFEVARMMVNEDGGIDGRMIEFVDADAPDPTAGSTEAERLISQE